MLKFLFGMLVAVLCVAAWLLTRPAAPRGFAESYHDALSAHPGSTSAIESGLDDFQRVYGDLTHGDLGARIRSLYAETMYFNDSLKTFTDCDELARYMAATGRMLDDSEVLVEQVLRDGSDVFVRWTMRFSATAAGRRVDSESVGMSHLRFDADGRIVVHQDFWDSAAGLYRHLPVVGYALREVDQRMAAGTD